MFICKTHHHLDVTQQHLLLCSNLSDFVSPQTRQQTIIQCSTDELCIKNSTAYEYFSPQIENLQDQLRDKEKQLSGLKDRVKSLQTDTSNTDNALGTLEEALAEKVHTHTLSSTLEQSYINKTSMSETTDHPQIDLMTVDK